MQLNHKVSNKSVSIQYITRLKFKIDRYPNVILVLYQIQFINDCSTTS